MKLSILTTMLQRSVCNYSITLFLATHLPCRFRWRQRSVKDDLECLWVCGHGGVGDGSGAGELERREGTDTPNNWCIF